MGILLPAIVGLWIGPHVCYAYQQGCLGPKCCELALSVLVFLVPYGGHAFFHLHHWYSAWVFGMHFNHDTWWSRLTMSILWGVYLNGIAFFGRDPILTCAVTLYQSQNQECPYLISPDYELEPPFQKEDHQRSFNCSLADGG